MKDDKKIEHPFQIPMNFHDDFKSEFLGGIDKENQQTIKSIRIKKISFAIFKYAAVIAIAFIIGRISVPAKIEQNEPINIEAIYNQVNEDDIIDFVIEDNLLTEI